MRYEIGQRWYCDKRSNPNLRNCDRAGSNFWFVIIGKGSKPGQKLCRLELENPEKALFYEKGNHGMEQEYTHKHLQKYAVLDTREVEAKKTTTS